MREEPISRALLRGRMSLDNPGERRGGVAKSWVVVGLYLVALPFLLLLGQHHLMSRLVNPFDHAGRISAFLECRLVATVCVVE